MFHNSPLRFFTVQTSFIAIVLTNHMTILAYNGYRGRNHFSLTGGITQMAQHYEDIPTDKLQTMEKHLSAFINLAETYLADKANSGFMVEIASFELLNMQTALGGRNSKKPDKTLKAKKTTA